MKGKIALWMLFGVGFAMWVSNPASAVVVVGSCMGAAKYTTIQDAVNAAPSGSVIKICPGGYPEQVTIDKPLTLEGFIAGGIEGAFILPPAGGFVENDYPYSAQVLVQNTTAVTITNLIIDGADSAPCNINYLAGIDFHNASGTINKVAVHNQSSPLGCSGYGVTALVDFGQQAQKMTIENSDFRSQSTAAIFASGAGLTLNTLNNYIAGLNNARVSSFGIEYSLAVGTIQGNTVTNEIYPQAQFSTPVLLDSMGIVVYCSGASVIGNMISNTQVGVVVGCQNGPSAMTNATISGNKIFNTRLQDGIYIFSAGNKITSNTIVGSAGSGIHFDTTSGFHDASGNTVSGNTITEACAGILTTGTVTNTVSTNTFLAVDAPTQTGGTCGPLFQ